MSVRVDNLSRTASISDHRTDNRQIDCAQKFTSNFPFEGNSHNVFSISPKLVDGKWTGVEVTQTASHWSPHVEGTHIESSRHVIGDAQPINTVFETNPQYLERMEGAHIKVLPEYLAIVEISARNGERFVRFANNETYAIPLELQMGSQERVITKRALQLEMEKYDIAKGSMLCLQFVGCDDERSDWPYLTNEAMQYIYDMDISILALNVPSTDREKTEGGTSNHQRFFQNPNNLIIEAANFKNLPQGNICATLQINNSSNNIDCAACEHLLIEPRS